MSRDGVAAPPARDGATVRLCTFQVDQLCIGLEVGRVQEVVRQQATTPVPLAPEAIEGVLNLRGQIVTAIDLRRLLGLAPRQQDAPGMHAVVRLGGESVSLLVDAAGEVVEAPEAARRPVPATAHERLRAAFGAAYALPDRLLLLLDPSRIAALDLGGCDRRRSA